MSEGQDLPLLQAKIEAALRKVGLIDRDSENLFDKVESLQKEVREGNASVVSSVGGMTQSIDRVGKAQEELGRVVKTLATDVASLRKGVSPGSNRERIALILLGSAFGSAAVSLVFHLTAPRIGPLLAFFLP